MIGVALAVQGMQLLQLDRFQTGAIVLAGLFFYDIYWVFGTDVMVSVAVGLDAPIKLLFLREFASHDTSAQHQMLGLGDIVVPGLYIALSLRFDRARAALKAGVETEDLKAGWDKPYFNTCCLAYAAGLVVTIVVMHTFESAQPALLYLSPACLLSTAVVAIARGEVKAVLAYTEEEPPAAEENELADGGDAAAAVAAKPKEE